MTEFDIIVAGASCALVGLSTFLLGRHSAKIDGRQEGMKIGWDGHLNSLRTVDGFLTRLIESRVKAKKKHSDIEDARTWVRNCMKAMNGVRKDTEKHRASRAA